MKSVISINPLSIPEDVLKQKYLKNYLPTREIVKELCRDKSTLCREVNCNKGFRGYRPHHAHEKASYRLQNSQKVGISLL